MHRAGRTLRYSPTDLNHFLECEHLATLERLGRVGTTERDAHAELLAGKGLAHERVWLEHFKNRGLEVVEIELGPSASPGTGPWPPDATGETGRDWEGAAAATLEAMRAGAGVVYQGVFVDREWRGIADFLVRVDRPSALGPWSYEAWDTKLARRAKPYYVLQLCFYSDQLARLQGIAPDLMVVVPGTGDPVSLRYQDFEAYYRTVRQRFLDATLSVAPTYPYPVPHCRVCPHHGDCQQRWQADDHLSLVAGIRREQVMRLNEAGIQTTGQLAAVDPLRRLGIGTSALERLRHQASLQHAARETGRHRFDILALDERSGFRLLPRPSPGDLFFDMEGDPYYEPARGLEYLFGVLSPDGAGGTAYRSFLALTPEDEQRAFERFIDLVHERLQAYPDLHVYHYAAYEVSALKRLMSEHGTREAELDDLLRREVFVDLYQVVRQSLRISYESYSIKKVRRFFMTGSGQGQVADGADSILQFERWRQTGDAVLLDAIVAYNEEDCVSTLALRDWLLALRAAAEQRDGITLPWRDVDVPKETPQREQEDELTRQRRERLLTLAGTAAGQAPVQVGLFDPALPPHLPSPAAPRLMADLLNYHRREAKPAWWAFFDRRKKSVEALLEDTEAIADLRQATDEPVQQLDRSFVYPLDFPPQEYKLGAGDQVEDPYRGGGAGTITRVDAARGRLWLKRGMKRQDEPLPVCLVAPKPRDTREHRAALGRLADSMLSPTEADCGGQRSGRYAALVDLLERRLPVIRGLAPGSSLHTLDLERQKALVSSLDASCLIIQGPPGSGKTYTGARLIVSLLAAGQRVGVAANSHKAINTLLTEVEAVALAEQVGFRGLKKYSDENDAFDGRLIADTMDNADCENLDVRLVAGTSWLFARKEMDRSLDYLFVDEAGQVSLADALAMGTAARNLVLMGDPQQLPQVRQGLHPDGAGMSVLEHALGGAATVPEERGIFLARTWRMHPDVCSFISTLSYDGRLGSAPGLELQQVTSGGLQGAGLRYLAVEHEGNSQQSYEEARIIAAEVKKLLAGGMFTDRTGHTRPLVATDILVVAPFNMQVRCLREKLPPDVEVGTVDRFQGREAAVIFFSMTSSSGEDVPRGLEFLFSRHRFNVAVSRARALAVVTSSPRLLDVRCRTVEQMRLVNAVCRFAETAGRSASST